MINSVRNTVLSILNKNNYGYISPSDFNLFAKQAQLELFDGYFTDYNKIVTLENARRSHSGYADMGKQAVEVIEEFSTLVLPAYTSGNFFVLPDDFYYITAVRYNSGSGISVDAEYVKQEQINALLRSNLTPPSAQFPAYTIRGSEILLFPSNLATTGAMEMEYIREPRDPKWTYTSLSGGEPLFNASALDYQDFEIPTDDEYRLVTKILQYAGLSIREQQVQAFANAQDVQEMQL
jgi:hypothetical protein